MENHTELPLSALRRYIIRYGAKYMETYESDLYYDCQCVELLEPGESVFWMVSAMHTFIYSAKQIHLKKLDIPAIKGDRFNYRIDCTENEFGERVYAMTRVSHLHIALAVAEFKERFNLK